jgi:hypothetical protein
MDELPEQKLDDDEGSQLLSSRGKAALAPSIPYLNSYFKCLENPIHPVTNPTGYIALCVAESKLPCKKVLAERLSRPSLVEHLFDDCSLSPQIRKGDMAILLVEQYFDFARELADSFIVLERGEVVMAGGADDLKGDDVRSRIAI